MPPGPASPRIPPPEGIVQVQDQALGGGDACGSNEAGESTGDGEFSGGAKGSAGDVVEARVVEAGEAGLEGQPGKVENHHTRCFFSELVEGSVGSFDLGVTDAPGGMAWFGVVKDHDRGCGRAADGGDEGFRAGGGEDDDVGCE